jgi:chromate transporter
MNDLHPAPPAQAASLARPVSCTELFTAFTALALQGFGGVLAVAQRVLCEKKRWLSEAEFVEMLALAQVLPGPNVCNLSLMVGDRFFGTRGAFTALAGMMAVPMALVLAATALYTQFETQAAVAGALRGMGAVAAGMIIGTAIKLAASLRGNALGLPLTVALGASCFIAIALLRWPLVWVLLGLGALACALAWHRLAAARAAA